ncbi:hypothetical protein [Rhizobium leguminosarum]|uniref:hypothetical protein n=1 Tax=Rhizobium leguminosarum TaxID=384 RepID=UPI00143F1373|nr:hypothetical protein [Rhizobium leguminosarum]NKL21190.1 hypothetical protein [Rhizobium leguminosarum bv. viciae]NKL56896.1 hypothetical protein [Rhizobium leguminosarum bv. viciae]
MTENFFKGICWALAAYFLYAAVWPLFPPPDITQEGNYVFLILSVLFFLVPNAKKIELFQFLSFEAKIKEAKAKAETAEAKADTAQAEIKHLQMIQATLTNSLSSVNSNANSVYVQLYNESKDAAMRGIGVPVPAAVDTATVSFPSAFPKDIDAPPVDAGAPNGDEFPAVEGAPSRLASPMDNLILLRTDLEIAMRLAVGRNLQVYKSRTNAKYLTSRQLADMIIKQYPTATKLAPSFDFFFNTANAAAHGQIIPENVIRDALVVGTGLLNEVKKFQPVPPGSKEPEDD